jgi:hypothetical protein
VIGKDEHFVAIPEATSSTRPALPISTPAPSGNTRVHGIAEMKSNSPYASLVAGGGAHNNRPVARNAPSEEGLLPISALNPYSNRYSY